MGTLFWYVHFNNLVKKSSPSLCCYIINLQYYSVESISLGKSTLAQTDIVIEQIIKYLSVNFLFVLLNLLIII